MDRKELDPVIASHAAWLRGEPGNRADLRGADLRGANLRGADLTCADLRDANLRGADLTGAILTGAKLTGAKLTGAKLRDADLRGANLTGAKLSHFQLVPEAGVFTGYKKLTNGTVVTLEIPAAAKRTSSLVGRKCRAEWVVVLRGSGISAKGGEYNEGEEYHPDSYDDDIRVECTNGVHFFVTRAEAEEW